MINLPDERNIKTLETFNGHGQKNSLNPLILIVDDHDDGRFMLKTLLEMWKYRVIEATNGFEAISIVEKICPDVMLLDIKMPNLDGYDTARQIRQMAKAETMPIIFLSACAEAIYKQKAIAIGGNEYLTKPFDFEELQLTLSKYTRRATGILL